MDIIFARLPGYMDGISRVIVRCGFRVYYLELSGNMGGNAKKDRAARLEEAGVLPLPIENLHHLQNVPDVYYNMKRDAFAKVQTLAPFGLLEGYEKFFPGITGLTEKLQVTIHASLAPPMLYIGGKVNLWAWANRDGRIFLIHVNPHTLVVSELAPNVRQLYIPLDFFPGFLIGVYHILLEIPRFFFQASGKKTDSCGTPKNGAMEKKTGRIALVLHQGQKYGNLFFKDLFYSTDSDSDLHPERILHIDYSGIPCPSENLTWVSLGHRCNSFAARIFYSFRIISKGIPRIRRLRHILTLAILARIYVSFKKYHTGLEPYPELKIALIDYEILCPKELLLAFESRNIRTVAAQERFFVSFNNLFGSTIVSHYLCASPFSADIINRSPLYCVDVTLPVGQYRSDILLEMQKTSVPPVIGAFQNKGFRIITALGFHTSRNWQESHADPMLNWSAHRVFLEDMIRLSTDIPDVAIILRFKDISWMELPVFADILEKIKETDNMIISTD